MDINKIAHAIEADAGMELPGLKESLQQMNEGVVSRQYSPAQRMVREVRVGVKISQARFARIIGTPVGTLRDWEQGRFEPTGPAVKLAGMIRNHPELIQEIEEIRAY